MAIDPAVLRFALALLVLSILVEVTSSFNKTAAWALVVLLLLGVLVENPLLLGYFNLGAKQLSTSLSS